MVAKETGVGARSVAAAGASRGAQPQQVVVLADQRSDMRALAEEIEQRRKEGWKPDEAKREGGFFIGTDGEPHDAFGNRLKGEGDEAEAVATAPAPNAATVIRQTKSPAELDAIIKAAQEQKALLEEEAEARAEQEKQQEKIQREAASPASKAGTRGSASRRRSAKRD